ncbi:hypothetical protein KHP62_04800 [Rhodobacteraceae bacterium NNCM2]|nr:hypothetical protein [Coraliihabitans acroporae]
MTGTVRIEVAAGELIDKITILEIKHARIADPAARANVALELETLTKTRDDHLPKSKELATLSDQLREVNEALWQIEDDIRDCERQQDFGERFICLARAVYRTNDKRAALKREISLLLGSRIIEEKAYKPY